MAKIPRTSLSCAFSPFHRAATWILEKRTKLVKDGTESLNLNTHLKGMLADCHDLSAETKNTHHRERLPPRCGKHPDKLKISTLIRILHKFTASTCGMSFSGDFWQTALQPGQ